MNCPTFTKSKVFRISAGIVMLVIVSGVAFGLYKFNLKHSDLRKVKPAYTLGSTELFAAFETDETSASAKYLNKVVEVSGNVAAIEYGSADSTLSITLRPEDQFSGVICTFSGIKDQSQVSVKIGDMVSIRGECSGMLMDVLLNNCALVITEK